MQPCQSALLSYMLSPCHVPLPAQTSGQKLPLWHTARFMVHPDQHAMAVSLNVAH